MPVKEPISSSVVLTTSREKLSAVCEQKRRRIELIAIEGIYLSLYTAEQTRQQYTNRGS